MTNKITEENCLNVFKEFFPEYLPYFEKYLEQFGTNQGFSIKLIPFSEYVLDLIKSKNNMEIKKVFDLTEFLIEHGDQTVKEGMCTCFLEFLLSKDPTEIQFIDFVQFMGSESISYCKAWDEISGVKTKGL